MPPLFFTHHLALYKPCIWWLTSTNEALDGIGKCHWTAEWHGEVLAGRHVVLFIYFFLFVLGWTGFLLVVLLGNRRVRAKKCTVDYIRDEGGLVPNLERLQRSVCRRARKTWFLYFIDGICHSCCTNSLIYIHVYKYIYICVLYTHMHIYIHICMCMHMCMTVH